MKQLPSLDPPDEVVIEVIAEHLIECHDDPVEIMAEALGLPVREFLDHYLSTALN